MDDDDETVWSLSSEKYITLVIRRKEEDSPRFRSVAITLLCSWRRERVKMI